MDQGEAMEHIVAEEYAGVRLDAWLAQILPEYSRGAWQKHIKIGNVTLLGKAQKPSRMLNAGEMLTVVGLPERIEIAQLAAVDDLPILYEDNDVIVINKPSGLISHPKPGSHEPSVSGSLLAHVEDTDVVRPGIVHRLDKDTSGVMIIAKHQEAKKSLQAAFKARSVEKEYHALVWGSIGLGVQRINFGLSRSIRKATVMEVDPLGKASETYVQGLSYGDDVTLVQARPTTGRTHQIRLHLATIKHPIVGDPQYGDRPPAGKRLMLHAYSLRLPLPSGGIKVFTASPGKDFLSVLDDFHCVYPVQ